MNPYSRAHLSDESLIRVLFARVAQDRTTTALLLADLAEVDARKLYLASAYSSMYGYCLGELRFSEDVAYNRIRAARTARDFPEIFDAVAQGRLHLSGICLLATYLTSGNATQLLEAAKDKTKSQIEQILAERFPRTEVLPMVHGIP